MPNWVMNKIVFYGDEARVNDIREGIKNGDVDFDFNTLIPMPRSLIMTEGSIADQDVKCFMAEDEIDAGYLKDKYHNQQHCNESRPGTGCSSNFCRSEPMLSHSVGQWQDMKVPETMNTRRHVSHQMPAAYM